MIAELLETAKFILGFLPWILFLFLPTDGWDPLRRTVLLCLAASVIFAFKALRKGFILQWATLLFFFLSAISFYGFRWVWPAQHMGIIANGFLAGVIWLTVGIGKPFTLQYARADLPKERWCDEGLISGCRFIAIFWGILLLILTGANVFHLFYPSGPSGAFLLLSESLFNCSGHLLHLFLQTDETKTERIMPWRTVEDGIHPCSIGRQPPSPVNCAIFRNGAADGSLMPSGYCAAMRARPFKKSSKLPGLILAAI